MKKSLLILLSLFSFTWALSQGIIRGRLLDEQGLSLPGANIVLVEQPGMGTISDIDGNFTLTRVPAGDYTVKISYIGYTTAEEKVTVRDGEMTTLRVRMQPGVMLGDEILVLGDRLKVRRKH